MSFTFRLRVEALQGATFKLPNGYVNPVILPIREDGVSLELHVTLREGCTHELDTSRPLDEVVADLIAIASRPMTTS